MSTPSRFRRLWLKPLVLAVLTAVGLVFALVGDGFWDAVSWLALTLPIVAGLALFRTTTPRA